jgi:hypothetical protein
LTRDGIGPNASVVEKLDTNVEARETGTSGPVDTGGNGPQRAKQASSIGFGREGAICELIEFMQIPPPVRATKRRL